MVRLTRFWSLSRREKLFFFEATLLLLCSNACVNTIAFKRIYKFLHSEWSEDTRVVDAEKVRGLVTRSISRAAKILPFKTLCLSRSIAEFVMLRRRGIPAVMFAGLRISRHSFLEAHAWVAVGQNDKISEGSTFASLIRIGTTVE
jgi:Transglutaminase-like superfamily